VSAGDIGVEANKGRTSCPLPLGKIGSPFLPIGGAFAILLKTFFLLAEILLVLNEDHGGNSTRTSNVGLAAWQRERQCR
jgi:hypothetical protein